ncbi:MAG: RNA polymerase sigma factor [Candidatus Aminicenantes bacterium]|nr:RNA polymerase sigma factor [Candidatus Aminicenantes bacterium]
MNETTKQTTDEELALEAQAGSRRCFEELIARYSSKLFHFLRPKISNVSDVEDIIQETFYKLYKNIFRYDPRWKFSTWIYTAVNRQAISHYRSKKNKNIQGIPDQSDADPAAALIQEAQNQNLWIIAQNLKANQYEALWLRYVEDLSLKEIARIMQKSHTAARLLLHRARLNLGKKLQKDPEFRQNPICPNPEGQKMLYRENRG